MDRNPSIRLIRRKFRSTGIQIPFSLQEKLSFQLHSAVSVRWYTSIRFELQIYIIYILGKSSNSPPKQGN